VFWPLCGRSRLYCSNGSIELDCALEIFATFYNRPFSVADGAGAFSSSSLSTSTIIHHLLLLLLPAFRHGVGWRVMAYMGEHMGWKILPLWRYMLLSHYEHIKKCPFVSRGTFQAYSAPLVIAG